MIEFKAMSSKQRVQNNVNGVLERKINQNYENEILSESRHTRGTSSMSLLQRVLLWLVCKILWDVWLEWRRILLVWVLWESNRLCVLGLLHTLTFYFFFFAKLFATWLAMATPRPTGTALPICLSTADLQPEKIKSSGNDWSLASSLGVITRGWE